MKAHYAFRLASFTLLALLIVSDVSFAQQGYKKPPKEVLDILNAPVTPGISISPKRDNIILTTGVRNPPLADLAQPMFRLAGRRINPAANSPHRYQYSVALTLKRIADQDRGSSKRKDQRRRMEQRRKAFRVLEWRCESSGTLGGRHSHRQDPKHKRRDHQFSHG